MLIKKLKLSGMILLAVVFSVAVFATPVLAWEATYGSYYGVSLTLGDYTWTKYDHPSQTASYDNVDWPATIMFWGDGASVSEAGNLLWSHSGETMYIRYYYSPNFYWDNDAGKKSDSLDLNGWHARLYAASGYRTPHPSWDYYVIGTTHRDWLSRFPIAAYGWSQDAADATREKAAETVGENNVTDRFSYFYNSEQYRWEGTVPGHVWEHDGWAQGVYME